MRARLIGCSELVREWHAWFAASVLLVLAAALAHARSLTVDGFLNLYTGRWVARHGLPHHDPLTIAGNGRLWFDQQWLANLLIFRSWQVGGYAGVVLLSALAVAAAFALLFLLLRSCGAAPVVSALWTIGALAASLSSVTPRAQVFAFPLFAALLWWLLLFDRPLPGWSRWLIVPLVVLWGNLHGSVLICVAVAAARCSWEALHAARDRRWRDAVLQSLLTGAIVGGTLVNPYGTGIWRYYTSVLTNGVIASHVTEWQPLNVTDVNQLPLLLFMVAAVVVLIRALARRRRPPLGWSILAVVSIAMVFQSGRQEMWVALVLPVFAVEVSRGPPKAPSSTPAWARHSLVAGSAALAVVAAVTAVWRPAAGYESLLPHAAVAAAGEQLRAMPKATLLGDESVTLLLWQQPSAIGRVGYDIRYEIYSEPQLESYLSFLDARAPGWPRLASRYDVLLVARAVHPALAKAVAASARWKVVFSDRGDLVAMRQR
jgi:hypothetical protein